MCWGKGKIGNVKQDSAHFDIWHIFIIFVKNKNRNSGRKPDFSRPISFLIQFCWNIYLFELLTSLKLIYKYI